MEIEAQIEAFKANGGEIEVVPPGVSGEKGMITVTQNRHKVIRYTEKPNRNLVL